MLREARAAIDASGLANVELIEGDATRLPQFADGAFDAITCACGLLYIGDTDAALREWRRLLRDGGVVAFSAMQAGCPPGARIFRSSAAAFGVALSDPCAPLGSVAACRAALETTAFEAVRIVSEPVEFSDDDLNVSWESNLQVAPYAAVRRLSAADQEALRHAYLEALALEEREHPGGLRRAEIIYAVGRRTASTPRRSADPGR
jgi:SAM-dependent methyltransferase